MIAEYQYGGRRQRFETGIGMRTDGTTGPAREIVLVPRTRGMLSDPPGPIYHLTYDHLDAERDVLIYRVAWVEEGRE